MAEAAHVLVVQASSVLAMLMSFIAVYYIAKASSKASGAERSSLNYIQVATVLASASLIFMAAYHVFDIDVAQHIWHVGALLTMIVASMTAIFIPASSKRFG